MAFDTAPSRYRSGHLAAHDVRQRLEHERNSRLTQLKALEEAEQPVSAELIAAQRTSMQRVLKEIEAAFVRLADGTYGRCAECDAHIPAERLEILPYTRHCVGCRRRSD